MTFFLNILLLYDSGHKSAIFSLNKLINRGGFEVDEGLNPSYYATLASNPVSLPENRTRCKEFSFRDNQ